MPERVYPFCLPLDTHAGIHRYCHFTYHLFNLRLTMNYKIKNEVLMVCEVKINYQPKVKPSERPKISGPANIYSLLMGNGIFTPDTIEHREFFKVILLNNAKKLLGIIHLSEGSVSHTVVDVRHIMQAVILSNATGIVLCHNHPSGNLQPSPQVAGRERPVYPRPQLRIWLRVRRI
jgi:DNA repair protein RadC